MNVTELQERAYSSRRSLHNCTAAFGGNVVRDEGAGA